MVRLYFIFDKPGPNKDESWLSCEFVSTLIDYRQAWAKREKILDDESSKLDQIARSEVQMETGDEFLNFDLINKKYHIKISRFTKFGVVSLDFNHVEGFQKSEKLETVRIWGTPSLN